MAPDERAATFGAQPVAERAAIVAAGPIANFILAIAIFTGIFYIQGRSILLPRVETVQPDSAAARAGFAPGDVVVSIDDMPVQSFIDMQKIVSCASDRSLTFKVERGQQQVDLTATPERKDVKGPFGTSRIGVLGVTASTDPAEVRIVKLGLAQSVSEATSDTWFVIDRTASYIGGLFTGRETTAQLSGPVGVAVVAGKVAKLGMVPCST